LLSAADVQNRELDQANDAVTFSGMRLRLAEAAVLVSSVEVGQLLARFHETCGELAAMRQALIFLSGRHAIADAGGTASQTLIGDWRRDGKRRSRLSESTRAHLMRSM